MCFLFTVLPPLLQNRKLLSWIFGIDRGFACEFLVGVLQNSKAKSYINQRPLTDINGRKINLPSLGTDFVFLLNIEECVSFND